MSQNISSEFRLGIICGGQLGKMLSLAAAQWDITTYVLDANKDCPSSKVCNVFIKGHQMDYDAVYKFGQQVDMITFEIEHVNLEALKKLKSEGKLIYPDPDLLAIIQDKGLQKQFYATHQIPTSPFSLYENKKEVLTDLKDGKIRLPFVQKLRTSGYDGHGVSVIKNSEDIHQLMEGPCVIEDAVSIDKELSVIVARNTKGAMKCFPIVEMAFDSKANLVEFLYAPARVSDDVASECKLIAEKLALQLDLVGILAVEFFLDKKGVIVVNESAPRTHNSGHQTIEGNITSQYQQQLRAILGFPLGNTEIVKPSVMINLLGDPYHKGKVFYEGFENILAEENVYIHIYGKAETKPYRKMGHITVLNDDLESAIETSKKIKNSIKVISQ